MGGVFTKLERIQTDLQGLTETLQQYEKQIELLSKKLAEEKQGGDLESMCITQKKINEAVLAAVSQMVNTFQAQIVQQKRRQTKIKVCVCGRINSGKSTTINAIFKPNPPVLTSAAENTKDINQVKGTLCASQVKVSDVQGVTDDLFAQHLKSIVHLAVFDCILFVYTDSIKNVEFLLRTCVMTRAPVLCLRNKCDRDEESETNDAILDDKTAIQSWFPDHPIPVLSISAKKGIGISEASTQIKQMAEQNLKKYRTSSTGTPNIGRVGDHRKDSNVIKDLLS